MLKVIHHPVIEHKLTFLRDKNTSKKEFYELINEISMFMTYESTQHFPTEEKIVETPIGTYKGHVISGKKVVFVPIIRAGLGMMDGILRLLPSAKVGHIGLYRDEKDPDCKPVLYYYKIPRYNISEREFIIVDPMLATGGSASKAIELLKNDGAKRIKFMCIVAAPEGIEVLTKNHPDVEIFAAAVDEKLNDDKYIVPGLGDAGDRLFGTK